jgi:type IV pilus assembly protein PilW
MTLISLMVGVVIGLMLAVVLVTVFINANRNFSQDKFIARMQENARYAMRIMAQDLLMVGFWGPLLDTSAINTHIRNCKSGPDVSLAAKCGGFFAGSVLTLGSDCGPGTVSPAPLKWALHIARPLEIVKTAAADEVESKFDCIDDAEFTGSTDILVIKRLKGWSVAANRADSSDNNKIFLRTNGDAGMLLKYDSGLIAPSNSEDWEYLVHLYYIRDHFLEENDGIPTLFRKTMNDDAMTTEAGGVAHGIDYVHVMFGIDNGGDGIPDYYESVPSALEMRSAVTARIYVLARSIEPDAGYTNNKVYQLGDVQKDYSSNPDSFHRRVFTTSVQLRNRVNRIRLGSSV